MAYAYSENVAHSEELKRTLQGWWGVQHKFGQGVNTAGRSVGILEKTEKYMQMVMDAGDGGKIGGIRVSVDRSVELHNKDIMEWEYPSGGEQSGAWRSLHITDNHFTVTVGEKTHLCYGEGCTGKNYRRKQ